MIDDLDYYEKRLCQERRAAASAPCKHTRRVHEEMAKLYMNIVNVLSSAAPDAGGSTEG